MVWTPLPGMLKAIVVPGGLTLASRIACRSDPGPESSVFVTVIVKAEPTAAQSRQSAATAKRARVADIGSPFG
jgi:hypothetical protein